MFNESENMQNGKEPTNFGLPEGYFQKSAAAVMNKIEWQEEHKEFKMLLELKSKQGFVTPSGYFETSPYKLELLQYPTLQSLKQNNPGFTVPDGYFETVKLSGLLKVMNDKDPDLTFLSKKNPFVTTENYFTENEEKLKTLLAPSKKPAKVIQLFSIRRVAAIAALLLIAFGFWMYDFYFNIAEKDCGTIACIDKTELLKTKAIDNLETDELYELVNSKKLEENLKNNPTDKKQQKDSALELNEEAVNDLLDGI